MNQKTTAIEQRLGGAGAAPKQGGQEREDMFYEATSELARLMQQGMLPEEFDLEAACADPDFAKLLLELPPYAAARVYVAEQKAGSAEQNAKQNVMTAMQKRSALPQMSHAGGSAPVKPDYMSMSSADFRALEQELKRAAGRA